VIQITWWFVARAAGIVAALLLAVSVTAGGLLAARALRGRGVPRWLLDLHRGAAGLAAVSVGVHVGSLWADDFIRIGLADILVPLRSSYDPRGVLLGVLTLWTLVVLEGSSLAMSRLPRRWWRRIHMLSWPLAVLVVAHGWDAGTDAGNPVLTLVAVVAVGASATALVIRIRSMRTQRAPEVEERLEEVLDER